MNPDSSDCEVPSPRVRQPRENHHVSVDNPVKALGLHSSHTWLEHRAVWDTVGHLSRVGTEKWTLYYSSRLNVFIFKKKIISAARIHESVKKTSVRSRRGLRLVFLSLLLVLLLLPVPPVSPSLSSLPSMLHTWKVPGLSGRCSIFCRALVARTVPQKVSHFQVSKCRPLLSFSFSFFFFIHFFCCCWSLSSSTLVLVIHAADVL